MATYTLRVPSALTFQRMFLDTAYHQNHPFTFCDVLSEVHVKIVERENVKKKRDRWGIAAEKVPAKEILDWLLQQPENKGGYYVDTERQARDLISEQQRLATAPTVV